MSITWQGRSGSEEKGMRKTVLAKKRRKTANGSLKVSHQNSSLSISSLGSPVKAGGLKKGTDFLCMAEGGKPPEPFPFLPCIYFLLTITGEDINGQGCFSVTGKEMQKQVLPGHFSFQRWHCPKKSKCSF